MSMSLVRSDLLHGRGLFKGVEISVVCLCLAIGGVQTGFPTAAGVC